MPDLLTIRIIRFISYILGYDLVHVEAFGYKEQHPAELIDWYCSQLDGCMGKLISLCMPMYVLMFGYRTWPNPHILLKNLAMREIDCKRLDTGWADTLASPSPRTMVIVPDFPPFFPVLRPLPIREHRNQ